MVYETTLSISQCMINLRLIHEDFGTNIHNIAVFEIIVANILNMIPTATRNWYEPSTIRNLRYDNNLLMNGLDKNKYG